MNDAVSPEGAGCFGITQPRMARIPAGFFLMGSETGQDNERPVRRVWLDEFSLAECQVTHAEYAQFLSATGHAQPPHWSDPNFSSPEQPVVAVSWFDAAAYCEWLSGATGHVYRLPTEAEWERAARGGIEQNEYPWGNGLNRWAERSAMLMDSATSAPTFTNGAPIGSARTTTARRRTAIRKARLPGQGARREAGRGGTTRKCRVAPRGQASLPGFNMRTMVFASPAIGNLSPFASLQLSPLFLVTNWGIPNDDSTTDAIIGVRISNTFL